MAQPARDNRISRRSWLMAGLALPLFRLRAAESMAVSFDGDNLHVAAPDLHFLTGKALDRLKNADTVVFLSQITLFSDERGTIFKPPSRDRFVVSYDLWEEKFSVTFPPPGRGSLSHLSAGQAEAFCLENLAASALGIAPDRPFWLRFELKAPSQRELSKVVGDSGISLSSMVELFSRKPGAGDPYWVRTAGPLRLADLARTTGRGPRIG